MSGRIQQFVSFLRHEAIRIRYSNSYIQQLHKSLTISSLDYQYQSIIPTIFAILQQLMMDRLPKSLPNLSTHLPLRRYPLSPTICSERKYVTSKPEPEPGFDLPKPENRVYRRNPGLETLVTMESPLQETTIALSNGAIAVPLRPALPPKMGVPYAPNIREWPYLCNW